MAIVQSLCGFAVRQLIDGAGAAVGIKDSGEAIVRFLARHFNDHSQRLNKALQTATDRAWKSLEVALAGESLMNRLARTEDRQLRQQVRVFLDASPDGVPTADAAFRQRCLRDLRAARKAGMLWNERLDCHSLAREAGEFTRFSDPQALLDAERKVMKQMSQEVAGEYPALARLLELEPEPGRSLLIVGVRYFFRRAIEDDPQLFQGLAFAKLELLSENQEQGFAALASLLTQQGQRLESLLGELQTLVAETHDAVLDLQEQMEGQGEQVRQIGQAVQKLLEQHQLQRRELRPGDSLSIRNDNERQLVKQLVARYRALPNDDRNQVPALLNAIGKLEVVAGDFDAAQKDFQAVALLEKDQKVQAEAHHNAYLACLEKRDWPGAIQELIKAVKLDGKRFAPFAVGKYQPIRILGAGGFGVAFLCKHKYMDAQVVVKTLALEDLGRDADKVFTEAQVLRQLDHPAIIRISDCGYVDAANKSRPFLVMDYFPPGMTLEEYVKKQGTLAVDDLLAVARQVAEGLQAAHGKGILHRDVKPANLLVRKDAEGWKVRVIDFGLALRQKVVQKSMNASTGKRSKTLVGDSIAGTLDYAAPEQMGKREGEPVGPYSDVYGWAKTCCYALFQTTQPTLRHWQSVPGPLAELLGRCLEEDPKKRPQQFAEILAALNDVRSAAGGEMPESRLAPEQAFDFQQEPEKPPSQRSRERKQRHPKSRLPLLLGGGVALALVLVAVVLGVVLRSKTKAGIPGIPMTEVDQPIPRSESKVGMTAVKVDQSIPQLNKPKEAVKEDLPGEVHRFSEEADPVCCVAFGESGTRAFAGSGDIGMSDRSGRLAVWETATGKEIALFKDPRGGVRSMAISADGRRIVTAGTDRTLRLWNADTGVEMLQFRGHEGKIQGVAITKDGHQLLSGGQEDKTVRVWDMATGKLLHVFRGHDAGVLSVACSPDGHYALSGSFDRTVRLWDLREKKLVRSFPGFSGGVEAVAFSPDGRFAACGSNRYKGGEPVPTMRLWDTTSWKEIHNFQSHTEPVLSLAFSPDGRHLLTGSVGGILRLWETESGKPIYSAEVCQGRLNSVAYAPSGTYALLACADKTVRLWRFLPVPILPLVALAVGYIGVLAVGRAWVLNENEKERTLIAKKLRNGYPDEMPDLRWMALVSALQLLILWPLIFMQVQRHFGLYTLPERATFSRQVNPSHGSNKRTSHVETAALPCR